MTHTHEKIIYAVACVSALVLSLTTIAYVALQGRQGEQATCALRDYYKAQVKSSEQFLKLTPDERHAKYGSLGDVPDPVVRQGLAKERLIVAALSRHLSC